MFATLWRLLVRLFGREGEPPCDTKQRPDISQTEEHSKPLPERTEDKPDTDWIDRINRPPAGGDWLQERLRSLADEQKGREPESKGRGC